MTRRSYNRGPGVGTAVGLGLAAIAVVIAIYALVLGIGAAILSWGWNLVVPATFGGPTLDFGAAFALLVVLAVIRAFLFGSGVNVNKS
jgi:disulfide bond formation protein DsbB